MKGHHIIVILFGVAAIAIIYRFGVLPNRSVVSTQADSLGYSKASRGMNYAGTK